MVDLSIGFIDFITDEGVFGWVSAGVEVQRLARLTCADDQGNVVSFSTTRYRKDVSDLKQQLGKHGFCVPLELFEGLGRRVTFRDEDGQALTDGQNVILPSLIRKGGPTRPMRIFLHIPKTGGLSLRAVLARHPSLWTAMYMYPNEDGLSVQELNQISFDQRSCCRFVMGHIPFGVDIYFGQDAEYITFLREPKERLKSNFMHVLRSLPPETQPDLVHIANEGLSPDFDNLMTRMLAGVSVEAVPLGTIGEKDVELALHNLESSFLFIGLMDLFEEHLAQLGNLLFGEPILPKLENVAPERTHMQLELVDWGRVHHRNRFDDMLYAKIKTKGLYGPNVRLLSGTSGKI